jgi:hypothetical protein
MPWFSQGFEAACKFPDPRSPVVFRPESIVGMMVSAQDIKMSVFSGNRTINSHGCLS